MMRWGVERRFDAFFSSSIINYGPVNDTTFRGGDYLKHQRDCEEEVAKQCGAVVREAIQGEWSGVKTRLMKRLKLEAFVAENDFQ
ncbi:ATP-dependent metallopeptidase FtsH/Yme1/Tma family protein [Sesbania bispinosa]|nr:ATP-dependent metallopeptidase FtsH/Yme1/Tma family protein [Sesbania bispinosa]